MKSAIKWTLLGIICTVVLPVVVYGPDHLYGLLVDNELCEGMVIAVQPSGTSDSSTPEFFYIKLRTDDRQVRVFPSSDPKWMLIAQTERVRVRLFACPPWSSGSNDWQDAALLGVYRTQQRAAAMARRYRQTNAMQSMAARYAPVNKTSPIVNNSSIVASFFLLAMYLRSLKRKTGHRHI